MYEVELIDKPHDGPGPIYHDTPIPPRFRVVWNDWEGIEHELTFHTMEDARLEADSLKQKYDYVELMEG